MRRPSADAVVGNGRPLSWAASADAVAGRGSRRQNITLPGSGGEKNTGASAANGVLPPGSPTTSAEVAARAPGARRDSRPDGMVAKSHQQLYRLPLAGTYSREKRQKSSARRQRGHDSGLPSGRRYTTPYRPPALQSAAQALAWLPPAPPQPWY